MGIKVGRENPVITDLAGVQEEQRSKRIADQERKDAARKAAEEEAAAKASVKAKKEAAKSAAKALRQSAKKSADNVTEGEDGQQAQDV